MEQLNHDRFWSANEELRTLLHRLEYLPHGGAARSDILRSVSNRVMNNSAEIGDASRGETLDTTLLCGVAEYVKNFQTLLGALVAARAASSH